MMNKDWIQIYLHDQYKKETGDKVRHLTMGNIYYDTAYVRWLQNKIKEIIYEPSVLDNQERTTH